MKKIILIIAVLFCINSQSQESSKKPAGIYTTVSYYIGSANQCSDIWVGVFCTTDNQTLLVSSGIVHIGGSCPKHINSNDNLLCKDAIIKGDIVENSKSKEYKYCLTELLSDDEIYTLFEVEKNKILQKLK